MTKFAKFSIDEKKCICCLDCLEIASDNFEAETDGIKIKQPENDNQLDACLQAEEECPVGAISSGQVKEENKMDILKNIIIDGVEYAPIIPKFDGMEYKIVRTQSAGVFAGYVESRWGQEMVLRKARRLWRWVGAFSLSQLAAEGVKKPLECKFPCEVDRVELLQVIEILTPTAIAKKSIEGVPICQV